MIKAKQFILLLILTTIVFTTNAQTWADRPNYTMVTKYEQDFTSNQWDGTKFYNQWTAINANAFFAADISAGFLQYAWSNKRIISSKLKYTAPYILEAKIGYGLGGRFGGIVIRGVGNGNGDGVQEPAETTGGNGFNSEGIAFYPSVTGDSLIIQFSGVFVSNNTPVTRIKVAKPSGVSNFKQINTFRIEDFNTSVYVFVNNNPFVLIQLADKSATDYTTGNVYNAAMELVGSFSERLVREVGFVSICQRVATLGLYSASIKAVNFKEQTLSFDAISNKTVLDGAFKLNAVASSGLPITYTVTGPATIVGDMLTLTGRIGLVTVVATQKGNLEYSAVSAERTFLVVDNSMVIGQDYVDNWVATDALGRKLPTFSDVGPKKDNKLVGMFYYLWVGTHGTKVYDITKILKNYPSDPLSASNNAWGGVGTFHFWGEPEYGYYNALDPFVIRNDLQMLSNANIDFLFFDVTNGITYLDVVKKLCDVSIQMRAEGIKTPQISFTTNKNPSTVNALYNDFYAKKMYESLWFMWEGKPLILGLDSDPAVLPAAKAFFTWKLSWAWTDTKNQPNHWQWLDIYPQDYGWSADKNIPEQITVSTAHHPENPLGKSFNNGVQPPVNSDYLTEFTGQGLQFAEQWKRALEVDPQVIMLTQWNEWIAQRRVADGTRNNFGGRPLKVGDSNFIDVFSQEFNRDIAPMKGGHTDNYYYQMVSNIRKYKGMTLPQVYSAAKSIAIDGNFAEWNDVSPVFRDPHGDITHRNFKSYEPSVVYTNTLGRNDIIESRATYDANNIYFYVKTNDDLTPHTDSNWMLLFIDADRNKATGWEGYDYVINHTINSNNETVVKKYNGNVWETVGNANYSVNKDQMEIRVSRSYIGLSESATDFYFHWADNPAHLNDITGFFNNGDCAPDRRFNFNYSTSEVFEQRSPYKQHNILGTIELEDFDKGSNGLSYNDNDMQNRGGAYRLNDAVDIKEKNSSEYFVTNMYSKEWLTYSVKIANSGIYKSSITYASTAENLKASFWLDGVKITEIVFPNTGSQNTWKTIDCNVEVTSGDKILKVVVENANGNLFLDKLVFAEKDAAVIGTGTGLRRSLFNGTLVRSVWFKDSICSELDPIVNQEWTQVSPGCITNSTYWNARWRGEIEAPYSEEYTITLTANFLGNLWINNVNIINLWTNSTTSELKKSAKITLQAGVKVPIRVDYAFKTGSGKIKLEWESLSQQLEVIPTKQLYPADLPSNIINVNKNTSFVLYPNPATHELNIRPTDIVFENAEVAIYNSIGERIISQYISASHSTINIKHLPAGVYILKLIQNEKMHLERFIKN